MKKKLKKVWHQVLFVFAVVTAWIAERYWASALVFAVAILIVAPIELKRIREKKSQEFIKLKNIKNEKNNIKPVACFHSEHVCRSKNYN